MLRLDASGSLVLETASTESSSGFGSEERGSLAGNVPDRVSSRALSRIRRSPSWLCECVIVVFRRVHGRRQLSASTPCTGTSASESIEARCRLSSQSTDSTVRRRSWSPVVPRPTAGHRKVRSCSPRMRHPRDASSNPCWPACQGQFGQWGYARSLQPARHAPRR
jgi:hypothetical protein